MHKSHSIDHVRSTKHPHQMHNRHSSSGACAPPRGPARFTYTHTHIIHTLSLSHIHTHTHLDIPHECRVFLSVKHVNSLLMLSDLTFCINLSPSPTHLHSQE